MAHAIGPVALKKRRHIVGVIEVVLLIEVAVAAVARASPFRHNIESRHHRQTLARGMFDHHIEAGPIVAIARARLGVGPREKIDHPARTHLTHLIERAGDILLITQAGQARVDTQFGVGRRDLLLGGQVQSARHTQRPELEPSTAASVSASMTRGRRAINKCMAIVYHALRVSRSFLPQADNDLAGETPYNQRTFHVISQQNYLLLVVFLPAGRKRTYKGNSYLSHHRCRRARNRLRLKQ